MARAWLAVPLLAGCTQGLSRQAVDATAAATLASAQPIAAVLSLAYAPGPPQRYQADMRMRIGGQDVAVVMQATQQIVGSSGHLTYALTIDRMVLPTQTLDCGAQPLFSFQTPLTTDGHLGRTNATQTPGCPASAFAAANGGTSFQQLANLWLLPSSGLTTGTILRRDPSPGPNMRERDARGVVVGRATWRGREVIAVRLEGCSDTRENAASPWVTFCIKGANLLDPSTGLTVGAFGSGDAVIPGGAASTEFRMVAQERAL